MKQFRTSNQEILSKLAHTLTLAVYEHFCHEEGNIKMFRLVLLFCLYLYGTGTASASSVILSCKVYIYMYLYGTASSVILSCK